MKLLNKSIFIFLFLFLLFLPRNFELNNYPTTLANMQDLDSDQVFLKTTGGDIVSLDTVETFNVTPATGHTINLSSASAGDVRVIAIYGSPDGTAPANGTFSVDTISGWTELGTQINTGGISDQTFILVYRVWQPGDADTLAITYTGGTITVGSICVTYGGVDTTNPIDQTTPAFTVANAVPVSPSITTQTDNALVGRVFVIDVGADVNDTNIPAGTTIRGSMTNNPPSNGVGLGFVDAIQASAGPSGNATWTGVAPEEHVAGTFTLRPITDPFLSISSPNDLTFFTNDLDIPVSWIPLFRDVTPLSYQLYIDSILNLTGTYSNNSAITFNLVSFQLSPGDHNLTLVLTANTPSEQIISAKDTIIATVGLILAVPAGENTIVLEGSIPVTLGITLSEGVILAVNSSTKPPQGTEEALNNLNGSGLEIFLDIEVSNPNAVTNAWLNMSYAEIGLQSLNIDEENLKIVFYDINVGKWVPAGITGVDIVRKVIYANVNHFSAYSAVSFVDDSPTSTSTQSSITTSINTESQSTTQGLVGFELFSIVMMFGVLSTFVLNKKKNK